MRLFFRALPAAVFLNGRLLYAAPAPGPQVSTAPVVSTATVTPTAEPTTGADSTEPEQPHSADEGESTGDMLMPTSAYTAKKPYDQSREVLQKAVELWKQKQAQKASDTALEAYDDLMEMHLPRKKQSKARKKLRAERHLAAQIYIESSVAYIKQESEKAGNTAAAKEEARARLGDLRDVSREYLELQKQVVNAIMELQ